ncbi:UNVERIFIED_CONTAM: hypothetical protein HDU68_001300 [Siphonaria sp. JEL0065]|nr:hypothetical protein HDU68_001300 [Siphonaria sp. JEL0065]
MASVTLTTIFGGQTLSISVENSTIAFEDSDFRHSYRFLAPKLVAAGHRVIVQDLRGVGDSGTKFMGYSIEECSSDIAAVLDHLNINDPIILVGNSLSAASAVTFAANTPTLWISAFKRFFGKPPTDLDQYCTAVKAKMLSNCNHAGIIGAMIRASKEASWARVAEIKSPVLLVLGSKDPDFKDPAAENEFLAKNIGERAGVKVTQKLVDGVGHYPQAEAVDEVYDTIIGLIST